MKTVTIKTEPKPQEEDGREIIYTEIDIDLPNVKVECLERSERIAQTAGKPDFFRVNLQIMHS